MSACIHSYLNNFKTKVKITIHKSFNTLQFKSISIINTLTFSEEGNEGKEKTR